jgi:Ala-tRNA(Pro) deacylase
MISARLKDYLDHSGVAYTRHTHPTAYTSQEIAQSTHIPGQELVKSVILKAEDGRLFVAALSSNDTANLDILRKEIGCGMLRLASEHEFDSAFPTCEVGAMPPLGNIFDLATYCDVNVSKNREIEFNAGTHHETIRMSFDDFNRLAQPKVFSFAQLQGKGVQRLAA